MNNVKIVIVGGGTAGVSAATRARRINEDAEITIIEMSNYVAYPISALPAFICGKIKDKNGIISDYEEKLANIYKINVIKNSEVTKIDDNEKKVVIKNLKTNTTSEKSYDKLILANGSKFGVSYKNNCPNFFKITNLDDAIAIRNYIDKTSARNITIIGENYFALILANAFVNSGFIVNIISEENKLFKELDDEFSFLLKEEFSRSGTRVFLNTTIDRYIKNENSVIYKLELSNYSIDTQVVIYCKDLKPNTHLAYQIDIPVGDNGGILVNENMETKKQDIFAVGSVAESFNLITKENEISYFLGNAQFQGRVAGSVAGGVPLEFKGIIGTKFLKFNKLSIGITGLSENTAKEKGFDISSLTIFNGNYERFISGSAKIHIKVIIDNKTRKILGAEICGKGEGVDKRLDVFATAIYASLTVDDLVNLNLCYTPDISTYKDPINVIGMVAANKLDGISNSVTLSEINFDEDLLILDIRTKIEYQKEHLLNSLWIPLDEIRKRIGEIPKEKIIYIYGHVGLRGYVAERILKGAGFQKVYNINGGITSIKISENMK